jgi:hypothetical protein
MIRDLTTVTACLLTLGCAPSLSTAAAATDRAAARPLVERLRELSRPGAAILFSSELIPDDLTVGADSPTTGEPLSIARRLLALHGLTLRTVAPGVYAVVRGAAATIAPANDPAEEPLSELVVSASRYRLSGDAGGITLEAEALVEQPGVGDDPLRNLGRLPGIIHDGISAQVNVRGGETDEVLLLLDGFPLRRAFHLASYQSLFSVIDANLLHSAEIATGGFPARYGNRMSAVFDLHSLATTDQPQYSAGIDFFNASARSAGSIGATGARYLATGRLGTLSPLLQAFAPSVGNPRYADAYLRAELGAPDGPRLSANLLWARDELGIEDRLRNERGSLEDRVRYLWLRADAEPRPGLELSAWLGQSVVDSLRDGSVDTPGVVDGSVTDARRSTLWDLRTRVGWQAAPDHFLEGGIEHTRERASYDYDASARFAPAVVGTFGLPADLSRAYRLRPSRERTSAFIAHRWRFADDWTSELGWRSQHVGETAGSRWVQDPRVALRWQRDPRTLWQLSWGWFHQADEVHELKVEDGVTAFPSPQRSEQLVLGWSRSLDNGIHWRVEAFNKRQTDPRPRFENSFNRRSIFPELGPDRTRILPDYAELRGLETSLDYRGPTWAGWLSVTLSRSDDEFAGTHVARSWDQTIAVATGGRWTQGPWSAQAALTTHRGFPTSRLGATAAETLAARNTARLPLFLQLDLKLSYRSRIDLGELIYSFEVINASAHANYCCQAVIADGGGGLSLRRQQGLPLFPSLGLRWNW